MNATAFRGWCMLGAGVLLMLAKNMGGTVWPAAAVALKAIPIWLYWGFIFLGAGQIAWARLDPTLRQWVIVAGGGAALFVFWRSYQDNFKKEKQADAAKVATNAEA